MISKYSTVHVCQSPRGEKKIILPPSGEVDKSFSVAVSPPSIKNK